MRFEYLTVMNIKIMVSLDVTLCIMRGLLLRNVLSVYSVLTLLFLIKFGMYSATSYGVTSPNTIILRL